MFQVVNRENVTRNIDLAAKLVPTTGRVLLDGAGFAGVYVNIWLWDAKSKLWNWTNYDGYYAEPLTSFATRADGRFSLGIPKGLVVAWEAWKPGYGHAWSWGEGSRWDQIPPPPGPGMFSTSGVTGTLNLGSVTLKDIRLLPTSSPKVTGTPVPGHLLTTTNGTWNKPGVTFTYRWVRDGVPIRNATHKTYLVRTQDLATHVSARVIAHLTGWYDGAADSNALPGPQLTVLGLMVGGARARSGVRRPGVSRMSCATNGSL